jgi:recombination protein RecR
MAKRVTGPEIEKLIQLLAKVPGLGPRSARRAALHLVKKKEQLLGPLADAMGDAYAKVRICSCCGNVDTSDPCSVCTDDRRDNSVIIVVEDVSDLWALERAGAMNTAYHVLGGTLSPLDDLNIKGLIERVGKGGVREVIVAVNATVEGQTTAHYITDQLGGLHIKITRLAHGVPVGGELDYLDEGTLTAALRARTVI